jgi:molecular chaperone DnaJ
VVTERHEAPLDPYDVLGVDPGAGAAEIARAYRRLVRRVHPDSHGSRERGSHAVDDPGDLPTLAEIQRAYGVLRDPVRRAAHDAARAPRAVPPTGSAVRIPVRVHPTPAVPPIRVGPVRVERHRP